MVLWKQDANFGVSVWCWVRARREGRHPPFAGCTVGLGCNPGKSVQPGLNPEPLWNKVPRAPSSPVPGAVWGAVARSSHSVAAEPCVWSCQRGVGQKKGEKRCSHHISWAVSAVLLPRNGLLKTGPGRVVPSGAAVSKGRITELPLGKGQSWNGREGGAWGWEVYCGYGRGRGSGLCGSPFQF